ncbi:hypothetical protein DP116_19595 [Brasilonema bromeliae SPC951]|uniref:Uncharacterized protein n=1 Tax=Brasilonema bromeliae SPC951 TaxID=385972 RepID=A0ABX1PCM6_9CYAN|nr:hypothetical protein [Brasilonema bromeliae SPC951]
MRTAIVGESKGKYYIALETISDFPFAFTLLGVNTPHVKIGVEFSDHGDSNQFTRNRASSKKSEINLCITFDYKPKQPAYNKLNST